MGSMGEAIPLIVDGKTYPSSTSYPVYDPQDRVTVLHNASSLQIDSVADVLNSSKNASSGWKDTSIADKRKIFNKAIQLFHERESELIQTEVQETTASSGYATLIVSVLAAACLEETTAVMSSALRGEMAPCEASGKRMVTIKEPYGVVLSMPPWNAPATLCMRSIINPLAGGNCVILKTSEYSPKSHYQIAKIFLDAGLPKGVLNVVHVSTEEAPAIVKAFIESDVVRKVNFTGSTRVGRIISELCATNLKPVLLELGGKAPVVVCEDADLDLAANNIIFGGLMNQGQVCMSTASIIAHKSIASELQGKLAKIMKENSILRALSKTNSAPNPNSSDHRLRGLFSTASAERVKELYDDAIENGGEVVAGKEGFDLKLGVVQPVFVKGNEKMRMFTEEVFAPVIGIYEYSTDEEAVYKANMPGAGLSASVFSQDETKAWKIARGIESGAVHINAITVHDEQTVPHGGCRSSGFGYFNGHFGIESFCYLKTITITPGMQYPFFAL